MRTWRRCVMWTLVVPRWIRCPSVRKSRPRVATWLCSRPATAVRAVCLPGGRLVLRPRCVLAARHSVKPSKEVRSDIIVSGRSTSAIENSPRNPLAVVVTWRGLSFLLVEESLVMRERPDACILAIAPDPRRMPDSRVEEWKSVCETTKYVGVKFCNGCLPRALFGPRRTSP